MDKIFKSMFQMMDVSKASKEEEKKIRDKKKQKEDSNKTKSQTDHRSGNASHSSEESKQLCMLTLLEHVKVTDDSFEDTQKDYNFCKEHNEKWVYYCKEEGKGLCNKCKTETHHASTHHLHLVQELSKWVIDEFYTKIDQTENVRQMLKRKEGELVIPERSFLFGLEMINHVFENVIREVENEKKKIMDNFKYLIEEHCQKKFTQKAAKLHKELDKCTSYLHSTSKVLDDVYKEKKLVEVCNEFSNIHYLDKTMKKFEDSISKAEKFAVFWENDYQFVFHKNDFAKSLTEIIKQNVQFNLTTDKKDPKYQDLGKMDESSIVYVGGNNPSELSMIHYNINKMSRAEKQLVVPKNDKMFPISAYRSVWDNSKNLVYLFGGKTDGNYTTNKWYSLKQVTKEEGKDIEIKKLSSMNNSRAYHGACKISLKGQKYIVAVGGQQTLKDSSHSGFKKDHSDTISQSSSGFAVDIPRVWMAQWEVYDITNDKWCELPELWNKKSNTSVCALEGTSIVYCFGGWNGKSSVNAIERLNIADYIQIDDTSFECSSEKAEETKIMDTQINKKYSQASHKDFMTTWTLIVVKEVGVMTSAPNYRLLSPVNSAGCIALDGNCILVFGGKENINDGETDQWYMFFGNTRVKSINPTDHL